jgi:hypothetical protein
LNHLIGFKNSLPDEDVGEGVKKECHGGGEDRAVFFH